MKVKICGITSYDDAAAAVDAGADYLGFILYSRSPRYIAPADIAKITSRLSREIKKVGVFVNETAENIRTAMAEAGLDIAQLHGDESPEFAAGFNQTNVWKAMHVTESGQLESLAEYPVDAFVVDSMVKDQRGGTGICCDWGLAAAAAGRFKVMLAGGITPDNAVEAVQQVKPYGLDIASGVELQPGVKDHNKINTLFENLKKANLR